MERPAPLHPALRALPSVFSLLRLGCAVALALSPREWWLALVLAAGASDWIDGYTARRLRATSWIGGLLDGFTDKAFVITALLCFAADGLVAWWQVPLLLVRDVCVAAGVLVSALRRDADAFRQMDSRVFGKLATVLIFAFLATLLLWPAARALHATLYGLGALISTAAGLDYIRTRFRRITGRRAG